MDSSLYGVRIAGGFCRLAFYPVLQQIEIQRPVVVHQWTQGRSARWQTAHIQTLFRSLYARCLLNRFGFICYNRHIAAPFFLVSYDVKTIKDTIGPVFVPAIPKFRPLSVGIYRSAFFEPVFHAITQWRLVCLQFYQEIPPVSLILAMISFCMDMASAVTIFPDILILSISRGTAFISLLFSLQTSVANVMPGLRWKNFANSCILSAQVPDHLYRALRGREPPRMGHHSSICPICGIY